MINKLLRILRIPRRRCKLNWTKPERVETLFATVKVAQRIRFIMFGTLHWNSHNKEVEFVKRPHGSSNLEKNSACDRCRAKKCRSGAVLIIMTVAGDASALERHALSDM